MVGLPEGCTSAVIESLTAEGVDTRRWWGRGCHRDAAFAQVRREDLSATDRLAESTVGLPFSIDLGADDIGRIAEALGRALDRL
jgi:dTDP-4-amino-4,6-dideoxygalactose transaminase